MMAHIMITSTGEIVNHGLIIETLNLINNILYGKTIYRRW